MAEPDDSDSKQPLRPGAAIIAGSVALAAASAMTGGTAIAAAVLGGALLPYGMVSSFRSKPAAPPSADWPEEGAAYDPPASSPLAATVQAERWTLRTARPVTPPGQGRG
jgi:hypothetical protein